MQTTDAPRVKAENGQFGYPISPSEFFSHELHVYESASGLTFSRIKASAGMVFSEFVKIRVIRGYFFSLVAVGCNRN